MERSIDVTLIKLVIDFFFLIFNSIQVVDEITQVS